MKINNLQRDRIRINLKRRFIQDTSYIENFDDVYDLFQLKVSLKKKNFKGRILVIRHEHKQAEEMKNYISAIEYVNLKNKKE